MKLLSKRKYIVARRNISGLLRVALADFELCEQDPQYTINMFHWHLPHSPCAVCFAGGVMAQTIGLERTTMICGYYNLDALFTPLVSQQLRALNDLRLGAAFDAWDNLELPTEEYPLRCLTYVVPEYAEDRAGFKWAMRRMADRFEKAGY